MAIAKEKDASFLKSMDGIPNPIDSHVGERIKLRRRVLGYSQEKLAEELGITFQQVQKYERGLNRVGASRLWKLAKILAVSVNFFYDGLDDEPKTGMMNPSATCLSFNEDAHVPNDDILSRRDVLELVRHYIRITDPRVAKNVLDLVKSISLDTATKEE